VFIPTYRRKVVYGHLRQYWGEVWREWARHKERRGEEGPLPPDHVHVLRAIPPQSAVAQVGG
jgi:REP element-mobilizing transposase RayT